MRVARHLRAAAGLPLLALAAACADDPAGTRPELAPPSGRISTLVTCTVSVSDGRMRCTEIGGSAGGARRALNLNRQDVDVRVESANTFYDAGTEIFQSDVTVQNLASAAIGTLDGATAAPDGIRVFFHTGPTVVNGTGTVTVANADGTATFTAADQPYHLYATVLQPRGVSAPKTWRWNVPTTVQDFAFTLMVNADLPFETGVLRWTRMSGPVTTRSLNSVWGTDSDNVFASGDDGTLLHYDGVSWRTLVSSETTPLDGIWAGSPRSVFAVGAQGASIFYDGSAWTNRKTGLPTTQTFNAVDGAADTAVFAVTNQGNVWRWGGARWDSIPSGTKRVHWDVWAASPTEIFTVGDGGMARRWNGASWDSANVAGTNPLRAVWGRSSSSVYAGGGSGKVFHFDGVSWDSLPYHDGNLVFGIGGAPGQTGSADTVWVTSAYERVRRWNGSSWTMIQPYGANISLYDVWVAPDRTVFIVGVNGTILTGTNSGSTLTAMNPPGFTTASLTGVWAGSASDVWAVESAKAWRWNGTAWSSTTFTGTNNLRGVWGSGAGDVVAVGDRIRRWNGSAWSDTTLSASFHAVWGAAANDVFAVGDGGKIFHFDGTAWTQMTSGTTQSLRGVWGTSSTDVWAVGLGGTVLRWNGSTWSAVTGFVGTHYAVAGTSSTDVYVAGLGGIRRWDGTTWQTVTGAGSASVRAAFAVGGQVFFSGTNGALLRRKTATTVLPMSSGVTGDLLALGGTAADNVYAVGAGGVVLRGIY